MRQLVFPFCLILNYILYTHTKLLLECTFDNNTLTNNCFTPPINVVANVGNPTSLVPNGALSDVTSSLTPTTDGAVCKLPYKVGLFTWDMYFCNRGVCPTEKNSNSSCKPGKFGSTQLTTNNKLSFQLKTASGGIDGVDQQCLIYYYYMAVTAGGKIINVIKQEINGIRETIDSITNTPFNGWIQRNISFKAQSRGYQIYFEAQRTSGFSAPYVGFDEISIRDGSCEDQHVTDDATTATSILIQTTTKTLPAQTTTKMSEPIVTTMEAIPSTTTTMPEPIVTTMEAIPSTTTTMPEPIVTTMEAIPSTTTTMPEPIVTTMEAMSTTILTTLGPFATTKISTEPTSVTYLTATTTAQLSSLTTTVTTTRITTSTTTSLSTTATSIDTTRTITIPFTLSTTTTSITPISITSTTTTNSIIETTTTEIIENIIVASYKQILPREKSHIIVMSTIIPIVWIAFIIAFLWAKRSNSVIYRILHPFTNRSGSFEISPSYELEAVSEA